MIRVVLFGFGHVGSNLLYSLHKNPYVQAIQLYTRKEIASNDIPDNVNHITDLSQLSKADIYIIAISDDAISTFSKTLPLENQLVVHTSGSLPMEQLSPNNRRGVFYPLQSFSKTRAVSFTEIPICIEAEEENDLITLRKLGDSLSEKVVTINSEERGKLHLAAVFVNNFVNHMYRISHDYLNENEIDFALLKPLIKETARKIETLSPAEAQTGPAKRDDIKTIEKHLHLLTDSPYQKLYNQLTEAIQKTYGKQL